MVSPDSNWSLRLHHNCKKSPLSIYLFWSEVSISVGIATRRASSSCCTSISTSRIFWFVNFSDSLDFARSIALSDAPYDVRYNFSRAGRIAWKIGRAKPLLGNLKLHYLQPNLALMRNCRGALLKLGNPCFTQGNNLREPKLRQIFVMWVHSQFHYKDGNNYYSKRGHFQI